MYRNSKKLSLSDYFKINQIKQISDLKIQKKVANIIYKIYDFELNADFYLELNLMKKEDVLYFIEHNLNDHLRLLSKMDEVQIKHYFNNEVTLNDINFLLQVLR